MNSSNRLLFAAARGARIEIKYNNGWEEDPCLTVHGLQDPMWAYRIHPDDEHLQYGPISTELRVIAETGKEPCTLTGLMAMAAFKYEREYPFVLSAEWPHAEMFLLILAEALADEGL